MNVWHKTCMRRNFLLEISQESIAFENLLLNPSTSVTLTIYKGGRKRRWFSTEKNDAATNTIAQCERVIWFNVYTWNTGTLRIKIEKVFKLLSYRCWSRQADLKHRYEYEGVFAQKYRVFTLPLTAAKLMMKYRCWTYLWRDEDSWIGDSLLRMIARYATIVYND